MKWFQVDSNTPSDYRIQEVLVEMGSAGLGALFRLWCYIADHGSRPGRSLDSKGHPIPVAALVATTAAKDFSAVDFTRLVAICTRNGHFSLRAWDRHQEIYIPAMARRADTYTKRTLRRVVAQSSKHDRRFPQGARS